MNNPQRELQSVTVRSIVTGMCVGALLTPCNIYSGLKIGWSFNMSIMASLMGYALWKSFSHIFGVEQWSVQENVYNQTTASAAASIISGGLVAPIPAYTMITGNNIALPVLCFWVFIVSMLGVLVAVGIRDQMLIKEGLPFPAGIATAETIKDIHSEGKEAQRKILFLMSVSIFAFVQKIVNDLYYRMPMLNPLGFVRPWNLKGTTFSIKSLGLVFEPSLMMLGFGMIMGMKSAFSLLLGALVSWGIIVPWLINQSWVTVNPTSEYLFGDVVTWTLWPGVGMMVTASLTSFFVNMVQLVLKKDKNATAHEKSSGMLNKTFLKYLAISIVVVTTAQYIFFEISIFMGILAVICSIFLGVVSSRVSGETGIPPIGALGQVTQLTFGVMNPGLAVTNLMTANVTGGAAGQSADLLQDLKTGLLLKVDLRHQIISQCFGIAIGALVGSVVYVFLIPDPANQLLTAQWPAPAVATWKSVAELMANGWEHIPPGALGALLIGSLVGIAFSLVEKFSSERVQKWMPSAASMGLAFVIPAWTSLTMFLGALIVYAMEKYNKQFARSYALVLAAGLVAGESIAGVISIVIEMFFR